MNQFLKSFSLKSNFFNGILVEIDKSVSFEDKIKINVIFAKI